MEHVRITSLSWLRQKKLNNIEGNGKENREDRARLKSNGEEQWQRRESANRKSQSRLCEVQGLYFSRDHIIMYKGGFRIFILFIHCFAIMYNFGCFLRVFEIQSHFDVFLKLLNSDSTLASSV